MPEAIHKKRPFTYDSIVSHQEVYGIFEALIQNPGKKEVKHGNTTSVFSGKQEHHLDVARAELRNSIISNDHGLVANFSMSWQQNGTFENFEDILVTSYLACINNLLDQKPNLIPAYYAFSVSSKAGAAGLQLALNEGIYQVHTQNVSSDHNPFIGEHYAMADGQIKLTSKTECAAPALAMKVIDEVQRCVKISGLQIDLENTAGRIRIDNSPAYQVDTLITETLTQRMQSLGYQIPNQ